MSIKLTFFVVFLTVNIIGKEREVSPPPPTEVQRTQEAGSWVDGWTDGWVGRWSALPDFVTDFLPLGLRSSTAWLTFTCLF